MTSRSKIKLGLLFLLPVQLLLFKWLSNYPDFIETFYSQGFYKYLSLSLRLVTGIFPIPIGQLLVFVCLAIFLIIMTFEIISFVRKKVYFKSWFKHTLLNIGSGLSIIYLLFMAMWSLNYHRKPVDQIVAIQKVNNYSTAQIEELYKTLVALSNESRDLIANRTYRAQSQLFKIAQTGYDNIAKVYPAFYHNNLSVKAVMVPKSMSLLGISGLYFPFTGEALINSDPPIFILPFTVCHEMAHQLGFAREEEANYIAYLACRHNPDPLFQYAANFVALKYVLNLLKKRSPESYAATTPLLSEAVIRDLSIYKNYWKKFQGPVNKYQSRINDLFLKANDQKAGSKSYNLMVQLLLGDFQKNGLEYDIK